jgi:short-subunit dehydrogenase
LGLAYAQALARRGLNLVLVARQEQRLLAAASQIRASFGVDVVAIPADLADWSSAAPQIEPLVSSIGLLVYNAAYAPIGLFEDKSATELSQAAAVNVASPLLLTKLVSKHMIEQHRGGIILMSSLAGAQGSPNLVAYSATKSFNATLAQGLWKELKPHGIDVLACCAGAILTPGYQRSETAKPAIGTLPASSVAELALNALGRGPVVVPGAVNKIGYFVLTRILSKKAAIALMSKNTGGLV